jgi:8-oxo-dGTP pyrophosphatase MutT (NUDIX family)
MRSIVEHLIADKDRKYTKGDTDDFKAVAAVIKNENNDILMQKHNKFGFWTIPCGKVDLGESLEFAVNYPWAKDPGASEQSEA